MLLVNCNKIPECRPALAFSTCPDRAELPPWPEYDQHCPELQHILVLFLHCREC